MRSTRDVCAWQYQMPSDVDATGMRLQHALVSARPGRSPMMVQPMHTPHEFSRAVCPASPTLLDGRVASQRWWMSAMAHAPVDLQDGTQAVTSEMLGIHEQRAARMWARVCTDSF